VHVLSDDEQHIFNDRTDAGMQLANRLRQYREQNVLVLGIPRGGVPVAAAVAAALNADLDIVVARKLGAPVEHELAIGAVTANGGRFLNEHIIRELRVPLAYLDRVTADERAEAKRRESRLRGGHAAPRIKGRVVIIVDDGLATGATMRAAVQSVRKQDAGKAVVAVPVGSVEACAALRGEADEVVCLWQPDPFFAVGVFYRDFRPTEDADVLTILQAAFAEREGAVATSASGPGEVR
jgi:predicted phosphoribosyltransferase